MSKDMAELTSRLAITAIEQNELYQAAKRDAEEAEAYVAELEAKLAKVIAAYRIEAMRRDDYSHAAFDQHIAELKGENDG